MVLSVYNYITLYNMLEGKDFMGNFLGSKQPRLHSMYLKAHRGIARDDNGGVVRFHVHVQI